MASLQIKQKKLKGPRGGNWNVDEINLLIEEAEQCKDFFKSKFTNTVHLNEKNDKWRSITSKLNSLGYQNRSVEQVRTKWNNLNREAKKIFAENTKERKKTGGGPSPAPVSGTTEKLIELNKDSTSFVGISGGFSTSGFGEKKDNVIPAETADTSNDGIHEDSPQPGSSDTKAPQTGPSDTNVPQPGPSKESNTDVVIVHDTQTQKDSKPISVSVHHNKIKRRKVTMEDIHSIQYEVLQKESLLIESKQKFYDLQNEKLLLEISVLKQQMAAEEHAQFTLDLVTQEM